MKLDAIATALYAVFLFVGGMIGYYTVHSLPSLVMGSTFSGVLLIAAWGLYRNCNYSRYITLALTAILLCFFSYRFFITNKFFPAGLMVILSIVLLLVLMRKCLCCNKTKTS